VYDLESFNFIKCVSIRSLSIFLNISISNSKLSAILKAKDFSAAIINSFIISKSELDSKQLEEIKPVLNSFSLPKINTPGQSVFGFNPETNKYTT
jgi:hypothetical protein